MSTISRDGRGAVAATALVDPAVLALLGRPVRGVVRRGRLVRRALITADVIALSVAFATATALVSRPDSSDVVAPYWEVLLFVVTLPLWVALAKLHGLYERDEERADHSTADELFRVVQLVTLGTWMVFFVSWATRVVQPPFVRLVGFWLLAVTLLAGARSLARAYCRRRPEYVQTTLIVGAGDVGQLVARKIQQHPEYGFDLIGFVDDDPRAARVDLDELAVLGTAHDLQSIVSARNVDRVIVAFSSEPDDQTMATVRELRDRDVIVDVVPRLFEVVGPRASVHTVEGLPLVCLPPARLSRTSLTIKRVIDIAGALVLLLLTAPVLAYIALRVRFDSPGPVLFRQVRLGMNMEPFTVLKFRSMRTDADDVVHEEHIRSIMRPDAALANGSYKLDREADVTAVGRWLRRTSLDELPQLFNVLAGDMSLVGPRPCIPYEIENFEPHQFERFLVPQGLTGLWQVTARAKSTFGEALEMDVAYVRGWSLGLDLTLLLRTPFALLRQRKATA